MGPFGFTPAGGAIDSTSLLAFGLMLALAGGLIAGAGSGSIGGGSGVASIN